MRLFHQIQKLLLLKAKYAAAGGIATAVDYGLWFLLKYTLFDPVMSHFISYPISVVVNFVLQKRYIFTMKRKLATTFLLAMSVSAIGWGFGTALMFLLLKISFFDGTPVLAKIAVSVVLFFYNFYGKRYVFEKRIFAVD
jgi:putative flippase GtrA